MGKCNIPGLNLELVYFPSVNVVEAERILYLLNSQCRLLPLAWAHEDPDAQQVHFELADSEEVFLQVTLLGLDALIRVGMVQFLWRRM